jgi:UDP-glucose 4-epimerase
VERRARDYAAAAMVHPLTVLVTGGSGFIGSHVVDQLLAAGHRPRIFDLRPSPYHPTGAVPAAIGDLADLEALTAAMQGCDVVAHLAAAADVGEVARDPVGAEERNSRGTVNVLEAARRTGIGRVLYASTVWVYSDTDAPVHAEEIPLHPPAHLYSATKLAGELYCRSYRELYGVESTVLRFGIPYGPRARPAAVVPSFIRQALAGGPLTIAGDGRQTRRFVYVEDLAEGIVAALTPAAANRVYNLVGEEETSVEEIAATVRELVSDVEIRHVPGRAGDLRGAPVSGARAAEELGWQPRTPFREGVQRYLEWHRAQPATALGTPVPAEPGPAAAATPVLDVRAPAVAVAPAPDVPAPAAALGPAAGTPRSAGRWWRRGRAVTGLLPRVALAGLFAVLVGIAVLGTATLVPIDQDMDAYDTFFAILILLAPPTLTGGFEWEPRTGRRLERACWLVAAAELAGATGVYGAHHPVLAVGAVTAGLAALLARERAPRRSIVANADGG